ncbi:MAG: N-6 DNA methylase [Thermoanaerobaculia bacterium]
MDLKDIDTWRKQLGLLPVPLFRDSNDESQFILLNGVKGNFCLDLRESQLDYLSARSIAWSSNVGYYLTLSGGHIIVQRWNRQLGQTESYKYQDVTNKLQEFHGYLENTNPDSSLSVVTHGARAFRSLRTALGNEASGTDALRAFLLLLASASEHTSPDSVDLSKWNLDKESLNIASMVAPQDWEILVSEFARGRSVDDLNLRVDLLLRHASGLMFQEAHYEALLPTHLQLSLGLFPPDPARLTKQSTGIGLHFTPPALARTLVEECLASLPLRQISNLKIFDPACGSGEFLREALRQLRLSGFSGQIELEGWDISDAACAMAKFALAWDISEGSPGKFEVKHQNSLNPDVPWPSADLLLMNPPFLSWQDMNSEQRALVSATLGSDLRKRPDLSAAFMVKASVSVYRPFGVLKHTLRLDGTSGRDLFFPWRHCLIFFRHADLRGTPSREL